MLVHEYTSSGVDIKYMFKFCFKTAINELHCIIQVPVIVKEKETLSTGIIVAVAIVGVALLIMVMAVVYWRLKIVPKTQTYDINSPEYLNRAGSSKRSVKDGDKVDANVNSFVNETYSSVAPADTSFSTFRNSGESTSTRESKHEKAEK